MAAINKEIGLDDALRGIGMETGTGTGGHLSDDEKLSPSESGKSASESASGKSARNGRAHEIEVVGKEL